MLLSYLAHSYSPAAALGLERRQGVVINRLFGEMYNLRAIASILTRRPLEAAGAARAGAPFQMPYSLVLPDNDAAFWRLHLDLIEASRNLLSHPAISASDGAAYAASLLSLDAAATEEMALYATAADVRTGARRMTGALA
jgi:hypothetical protein